MGRYNPFVRDPEEERKGDLLFLVFLAVLFLDAKWGVDNLNEWFMLARAPLWIYAVAAIPGYFMMLCEHRRWPAAIALVLGTFGGCASVNGKGLPEELAPVFDLLLFIVLLSGGLAAVALISGWLDERSRR